MAIALIKEYAVNYYFFVKSVGYRPTLMLKKGDQIEIWLEISQTSPGVILTDDGANYNHFTDWMLELRGGHCRVTLRKLF